MELSRHGRELYKLEITTTPVVASWEASFDGGETWVAGTAATLESGTPVVQWLVAGPLAALGAAVAVIASDLIPKVRALSNPEIVVRNAPAITLTD